jgi:hypothetical protein
MPTVVQTKAAMRAYADKHGLKKPLVVWSAPVWGTGAKTLAWRVTSHANPMKPSTRKEDVDRLLFPPTLADRVRSVALGEVGVTEHPYGSNDGPRVHAYQSVTGAYKQPWCASFVCWVYRRAGWKGQFAPLPAYVPSWTTMVKSGDRGWKQVPFNSARRGDVVTLWNSGHIEIVYQRDGEYLKCIGGNTSPIGQNSNGGMVAKTRRHRSEVTVVGRPNTT